MSPPKDAPKWFEEIWPIRDKLATNQVIESDLQADHETKDLEDNFEDDLNWRCPSCHRIHDNLTAKGISTKSLLAVGDLPLSDAPIIDYDAPLTADSWYSTIKVSEAIPPATEETN
jgi:hypothetical protein